MQIRILYKVEGKKTFRYNRDTKKKLIPVFLKDITWDQRKVYISTQVEKIPVKRKTTITAERQSRRQGAFIYYLNTNQQKVEVCRTMFLNNFDLGYKTVQEWVNNSNYGMHQNTEKKLTVRQALQTRAATSIRNIDTFFDELPKLPPHYASSKLFLEPIFNKLVEVYKRYRTYCVDNNLQALSKKYFNKRFEEKNLSIYTLKKDLERLNTLIT